MKCRGEREEKKQDVPKFLSIAFETNLLATHSTLRNTTSVHIPLDMGGQSNGMGIAG